MKVVSKGPSQTIKLGAALGRRLVAGDVIGLTGGLGAGKTTLTKGIAKGMGVSNKDVVNSPSFVLIKEHQGRIPLYHIDLYRLESLKEAESLGCEDYVYGDGVTVIEWAEKMETLLPRDYLRIELYVRDNKNERIIKLIPFGRHYRNLLKEIGT